MATHQAFPLLLDGVTGWVGLDILDSTLASLLAMAKIFLCFCDSLVGPRWCFMLVMTQKNVSDRLGKRRQWSISHLKDISYLPGLLGVRLCRELASMSMIVLRSRIGGGQAGLQIGKPQTHRWISKINIKTLPLKRTMSKWYNDTMNCYISPGWDFGDCFWSGILGNREAVLQNRWSAGWCH